MADDLSRVPYAIRLARMARHTVRFNIAAALGSLCLMLDDKGVRHDGLGHRGIGFPALGGGIAIERDVG